MGGKQHIVPVMNMPRNERDDDDHTLYRFHVHSRVGLHIKIIDTIGNIARVPFTCTVYLYTWAYRAPIPPSYSQLSLINC